MFDNQIISIEVSEESNFSFNRKITVDEMTEFLKVLSSSYKTAQHLSSTLDSDLEINIDSCLKALLVNTSQTVVSEKNEVESSFINDLNFYNNYSAYAFNHDELEIVSINYNSPLTIEIIGKSLRNLVIAIALMGGEMNTGDFSVKMPGIADMIQKLSTTYIEIKKFSNDQSVIDKEIDKHIGTLPHTDINSFNALQNGVKKT
jgi:hypothetical protein